MIDYDYEWKLLLERLFKEAVQFFMPELYHLIDFDTPPIFLEQEFQKLFAKKYHEKRKSVDKLAKVRLKDGSEKWILLHIEIQSYFETNFSKRMFTYYYLIIEKYGDIDLTAIAIYTGSRIPKKYNEYRRNYFGTTLSFKFNTYKVRDQVDSDLIKNRNPFAMAILASLYLINSCYAK